MWTVKITFFSLNILANKKKFLYKIKVYYLRLFCAKYSIFVGDMRSCSEIAESVTYGYEINIRYYGAICIL